MENNSDFISNLKSKHIIWMENKEALMARGEGILKVMDPAHVMSIDKLWTHSEFMEASAIVEQLECLSDKIEFIHWHTGAIGLFDLVERNIGDIKCQYGIQIKDVTTAREVCQYYLKCEKPIAFSLLESELKSRLDKCGAIERTLFIDAEINRIEQAFINGLPPFVDGYLTEKRKANWFFFELGYFYNKGNTPGQGFLFSYLKSVIKGATSYLILSELQNLKKNIIL